MAVGPRVDQLLHLVGLEATRGRRYAPCPKCGHGVDGDRRGTVLLGHGGATWRCVACMAPDEKNLDGYDLLSYARHGVRARELGSRFKELLDFEPMQVPTTPAPKLDRIPEDELRDLFRRCTKPQGDTAAFLTSRRIDPALAPCGVLPPTFSASWWPQGWSETWPLVAPMFDASGALAGLHARAIGPAPSKTRWPVGVDCRGLLFVAPSARPWLRGGEAPDRVLVVEGFTDFLTACTQGLGIAVLGIESGSAEAFATLPWKSGCRVIVATDPDKAGDGYARRIVDALPSTVLPYSARPILEAPLA